MNSETQAAMNPADFGARARRRLLIVLTVGFAFNYVDRNIIATIGQAIKVDLKISDAQLGLLNGLYFALLYTLFWIPIARVAERVSRVNVIVIAIVVWSAFTALCAAAGSFAMLAACRVGVGIGEAGFLPPAHSLIGDYFKPKERTLALSLFNLGITAGIMAGAIAGGWLAQNFSWRAAFVLVGLPGALVAAAVKLWIKEPPRGLSDPEASAPLPAVSIRHEVAEICAVCATLFGSWPVFNVVLGLTIATFGAFGSGTFIPAYFIRAFGLDLSHAGFIYGLIYGIAPAIATLATGFLAERLGRRHAGWYALIPGLGLLMGAPLYVMAFSQASWQVTALALFLPLLLAGGYIAPAFGIVQNMVDTRRRATAIAILYFVMNLIALGGGPPLTGWIIDRFAGFNLEHAAVNSIWPSLKALATAHTADFQRICPGGAAPAGAPPRMDVQCKAALSLATRHGIMVVLCFYGWGGIHYLFASFGLRSAMASAGERGGEAA